MNDESSTSCSIVCENELWISASSINGLFCWNLDENRITYQGVFEAESLYGRYSKKLYSKIYCVNNNLIFIPHNAQEFAIYNLTDATMKKCKFKIRYDVEYIGTPLYGSTEMNGKIYEIIPYQNIVDVIVYDIESNQADVLEELTQYLFVSRKCADARYAMAACEGYLYILEIGTDLLLEYNVEKRECKTYSLYEYGNKFINLIAVDKGLFLLSDNGKEVIGQRKDNNLKIEEIHWATRERVDLPENISLQCEGCRVFGLWEAEECFICYNIKEKTISRIGIKDIQGEKIFGYCIAGHKGNNIYAYSSKHIFKIDVITGCIEKTQISIDKVRKELLERLFRGEQYVVEDTEHNLENYLQYIKGKED